MMETSEFYKMYCEKKYYDEFNGQELLKHVQERINPNILHIEKEFNAFFNMILRQKPCIYIYLGKLLFKFS